MDFHLDEAGCRELLSMQPHFILVIDRDGFIRYINRVEEGYDIDQVIGMHSREVLDADSIEETELAIQVTLDSGETQEHESMVNLPDGSDAWYRSQTFPIRQAGEIVAVMLVANNITELKLAEAAAAGLRQLLPICSWCNRIQDDAGSWEPVESRLERTTGSRVTHGMCPDCYQSQLVKGDGSNGSVS